MQKKRSGSGPSRVEEDMRHFGESGVDSPPPMAMDSVSPLASTPAKGPWTRSLLWPLWLVVLVGIGLVSRVAPFWDAGGRLLRQFPTEDGYLTLQIARNMALGHGMSVSDGLIPTNGTQPFATFLWSLAFRIVDADKVAGVRMVLSLELLIAVATAFAIAWAGRRLLANVPHGRDIARLAACAWFASPIVLLHSMNCLESGIYALAVVLVVGALTHAPRAGAWTVGQCLGIGALLGWTFWVRNDAVFLIGAFCLVHWVLGARQPGERVLGRPLLEAIVVGTTTVGVALPWLFYNVTTFGHLMPISGIAESHAAAFAQNLHLVPIKLFEYLAMFAPIPFALESELWISLLCAAGVLLVLVELGRRLRRGAGLHTEALAVVLVYGFVLASYYGLSFGAAHFVGRYMFPLASFGALIWATIVLRAWLVLDDTRGGRALVASCLLAISLLAGGFNALIYKNGPNHMHFQVVAWVEENVPDEHWVGAIQTGTLGYFHDRTLNLDGKVNPYALEVKLVDGIPQYVVDQPIRVLIDWVGITSWMKHPPIAENFDVAVHDEARNLGVLVRHTEPPIDVPTPSKAAPAEITR